MNILNQFNSKSIKEAHQPLRQIGAYTYATSPSMTIRKKGRFVEIYDFKIHQKDNNRLRNVFKSRVIETICINSKDLKALYLPHQTKDILQHFYQNCPSCNGLGSVERVLWTNHEGNHRFEDCEDCKGSARLKIAASQVVGKQLPYIKMAKVFGDTYINPHLLMKISKVTEDFILCSTDKGFVLGSFDAYDFCIMTTKKYKPMLGEEVINIDSIAT